MADTSCKWYDLGCYIGWMQEEVKQFFVWIAEQVFNALISIIGAIPIPAWVQQGADVLSSIPAGVGYFVAPLNLGMGALILGSAYGVRFLIRRIPLIG